MKDLIELANIVTKTKLRSVELFTNDDSTDSKIQQFYNLVTEGRFASDDDAAEYFYGKSRKTPGYQKLRKTLKDRLVNSLFIIDLKQASYTNRQKAYYECYKDWAAVKILLGKNAFETAEGIIRQLLIIARKYEFTELLVDIYHTLRLFHGTIYGDFKKYEEYNSSFKEYEKIWIVENRVEELYMDLSIKFINSKSNKADLQQQAIQYQEEIKEDMEVYETYQLQFCGWLIRLGVHTIVNDYEKLIQVCDDAITYFEKKTYVASVPLQVFLYQKCVGLGQLRRFDELEVCIQECLVYLEPGRLNWFKVFELEFLLYTHNDKYTEAWSILYKILGHEKFAELPGNIQETWLISEAYLIFLAKAGKMKLDDKSIKKISEFRLSRFLNEMEIFSKDKMGMNVSILIVEVLLNVVMKNYDELIDRTEAIDKYRSRYLKDDMLKRSDLFLKMLLQIPRNAFQRQPVTEKADKYYQDLISIPIETANQTYEIEVVPYEKLWNYVLNLLE